MEFMRCKAILSVLVVPFSVLVKCVVPMPVFVNKAMILSENP